MRIGLFTDTYTPEINGVVSSICTLQKELEKQGHQVYIVTTGHGLRHDFDGKILRLPGIELKKLYGYVLASPVHLTSLSIIKKMNLDIIHVHTEFGIGIFARIVAKMLNIPSVSTYHTTYEDYTHYINKFNLRTVDKVAKKAISSLSKVMSETSVAIISPSYKTKEMLERYNIKKKIVVIPSGLDLEKFKLTNKDEEKCQSIKKQYQIHDDEMIVLFVGRLAQEKSIDQLLHAMHQLKDQDLKIRLMVVGGGPDEASLHALQQELALEKQVIFTGKVSSEDIASYYHIASIFVSPSLTETQGLTFIEAMAASLCVMAQDKEVTKELITEDETGYYFSSIEELANKLVAYYHLDDAQKNKMRAECLKRVQPFDSNIFYENVFKLYQYAIATFAQYYIVEGIKDKNGYIELRLRQFDETSKLLIRFDTYLNMNIRKGTRLSFEEYDEILKETDFVKVYQKCIRKLNYRDYTRKEMYDYITQNFDLDIKDVNELIELLENNHYIDDVKYAYNAILSMKNSLFGEKRIYRELKKKGIAIELIEEVILESQDEDKELSMALKLAEKSRNKLKAVSSNKMKSLLRDKLYNSGYNDEIITKVLSIIDLNDDEKEKDILGQIAQKAYIRYSRKYQGVELRNRVYRYCASQGFNSDDIYMVLSEMEWNND